MGHSSAIGSSIEGEKVELKTRQFFPYPPKKNLITNQRHYPFKLGIDGEAKISEAYLVPREICHYKTSMVCVDDRITGTSIDGWALKALGKPNISKGSSSHSASFLAISGGCCAMVLISSREHLQSLDFQLRDPQITPVPRMPPPK